MQDRCIADDDADGNKESGGRGCINDWVHRQVNLDDEHQHDCAGEHDQQNDGQVCAHRRDVQDDRSDRRWA